MRVFMAALALGAVLVLNAVLAESSADSSDQHFESESSLVSGN